MRSQEIHLISNPQVYPLYNKIKVTIQWNSNELRFWEISLQTKTSPEEFCACDCRQKDLFLWFSLTKMPFAPGVRCAKLPQSCPTVCDPMDCSPPGSSVHGDPPGKNTGGGCMPASLMSVALAGGLFTTSATWEALMTTSKSVLENLHFYRICIPLCTFLVVSSTEVY